MNTQDEKEQKSLLLELYKAGLESVNPYKIIKNKVNISKKDNKTYIDIKTQTYTHKVEITNIKHIYVIAFGKASCAMTKGLYDIIKNYKENISGIVVSPTDCDTPPGFKHIKAEHPVPGEGSIKAAKRISEFTKNFTKDDLAIVLISGGGSALIGDVAEPLTLEELRITTELLLKSGAKINEVNTIRKHLSFIKGGGLARLCHPAKIVSLILSDVVGDDISSIASGPTAPDPTTFKDALEILKKYNIIDKIPQNVLERLKLGAEGKIEETPKPNDKIFENCTNIIIGNNRTICKEIQEKAKEYGLTSVHFTSFLEGEASEVAKVIAAIAKEEKYLKHQDKLLIFGGETTVTVRGNGKGGRSQELAISLMLCMEGYKNWYAICASTDGIDGPTDAAGAYCDYTTSKKAEKLGLNPEEYLLNNDSYNFWDKLGELIKTGPTGTNVNDIILVLLR